MKLNGQENIFELIRKYPQAKAIFEKFNISIDKDHKLAALAIKHKIPLQVLLNHLSKATGLEVQWPKVKDQNLKKLGSNDFSASTQLRHGNIPDIKKFIAIHSGKGGVGKTFIAVRLALYFAKAGLKVGLIDLDIDCPNIMKVLELNGKLCANSQKKITPLEKFKIKVISMAGIQETPDQPILWRGPIVAKAVEQLLYDTEWGKLDILIADLPPGTGDVPLTLLNQLKLDGVIIVSTPQELAIIDAKKSINMVKTFGIPTLGLIENMTGKVFGEPQAEIIMESLNIPYLGNIPLKSEYGNLQEGLFEKDKNFIKIFKKIGKLLNLN